MSEESQKIIKYFCDRFLELDYYPKSIKAILDLRIDKLKDIHEEDVKQLNKKNLIQIRNVSDLDLRELKELTEDFEIEEKTINNIYIASNLIANAWNKRKAYLKKPHMKVVIAGLDFAGKTTLIKRLIHNRNYYDLVNLEPTKGANVEEFRSDKLNLVLWDLGGQKMHIEEYLEDPERYFIKIDLLIFVIDSQDDVRYEEATKYINDLLNIFEYLDEKPYILVLLNKADSDIIDDPDFQIKLEYLKDEVKEVFEEREKVWNVEIIPTSIFNVHSNEPEIATSIKKIFAKEPNEEMDKEIPQINEKLQKILNINLKFMNNIVGELNEMKNLLIRISPAKVSKSLYSVPFQEFLTESSTQKGEKLKQEKLSEEISKPLELGELLKKKISKREPPSKSTEKDLKGPPKEAPSTLKKDRPSGPPSKAPSGPPSKAPSGPSSKAPSGPSSKAPSGPSSKTPSGPPDRKGLHPPPSTPPSRKKEDALGLRGNIRGQMLSELKELFVKRGIANMGVPKEEEVPNEITVVKLKRKEEELEEGEEIEEEIENEDSNS